MRHLRIEWHEHPNPCDECKKRVDGLILFRGKKEDFVVCKSCLTKAVKMLGESDELVK